MWLKGEWNRRHLWLVVADAGGMICCLKGGCRVMVFDDSIPCNGANLLTQSSVVPQVTCRAYLKMALPGTVLKKNHSSLVESLCMVPTVLSMEATGHHSNYDIS